MSDQGTISEGYAFEDSSSGGSTPPKPAPLYIKEYISGLGKITKIIPQLGNPDSQLGPIDILSEVKKQTVLILNETTNDSEEDINGFRAMIQKLQDEADILYHGLSQSKPLPVQTIKSLGEKILETYGSTQTR